ncbi:MAG: PAS domain S-box protein [Nitrospina sp.]|nr:PAS domain S-box protein [Nitrospina sp.]
MGLLTGLTNSDFMPHGQCFLWEPTLLGLHLTSDVLIALAYYSIPLALFTFVKRRKDLEYKWVFSLFGAFILACGTTHLLATWVIWNPDYLMQGGVKFFTMLVSVTTATLLWKIMPQALLLPTPGELRVANNRLGTEIKERARAENELKESHSNLESLVAERTKELNEANRLLEKELADRIQSENISSRLGRVLDQSFNEIYVFEAETLHFTQVNFGARENLGYSMEELLEITPYDINPRLTRERFVNLLEPLRCGEKSQLSFETVHQRKDGTTYPVDVRLQFSASETPPVFFAVIQDITARKEAELETKSQQQQLIQADKMKSLGIMVSGVAHEINNPNNFIMVNTDTIKEVFQSITPALDSYYKKEDDKVLGSISYAEIREMLPKLLSDIRGGSLRIKNIVEGLKKFSRQDTSRTMSKVDTNDVIKSTIAITQNLINESTDNFSTQLDKNLPEVKGHAMRLEQVLVNLITNSCQALPDKESKIELSTCYDTDNFRVVIVVQDEGTGISKRHLEKICDPFFTTKRDTGGTGLGLSVSYKIVQEHGGTLIFESEPGKGTTATLSLPLPMDQEKQSETI